MLYWCPGQLGSKAVSQENKEYGPWKQGAQTTTNDHKNGIFFALLNTASNISVISKFSSIL